MGFSNLLDVSSFFIGVLINLLLIAMICFYFKRKIDNLELSQSEQAKMLFQIIQNNSQLSTPTRTSSHIAMGAPMKPRPDLLGGLNLDDLDSDNENDGVGENETSSVDVVRADNETHDSDSESESEAEDYENDELDEASDSESDEEESVSEALPQEHEIKKIEIHEEHDEQEPEVEPEIQIKKVDSDDIIIVNDESGMLNGEIEPIEVESELVHDDADEEGDVSTETETEGNINYEKYTIKELKHILESNGVQVQKKNMKKQELISMIMNSAETPSAVPQSIENVESIEIPENDEIN